MHPAAAGPHLRLFPLEPIAVNKTTLAVASAASLLGAFVCLPHVRGQQGQPADRAGKTSQRPAAAAAAAPAGLKVACFDMNLILKEYHKMADRQHELDDIANEGNAKIAHYQKEYQAVTKSIQEDKIDKESDEYVALAKKAYQAQNSGKSAQAAKERNIKMQSLKITAAVYADVQAALKLFCEQNGYTLVLQVDREADTTTDYRMFQRPLAQPTFYYRKRDDITVAVLTYLNDQYDAERKAAGVERNTDAAAEDELPTRSIPASPNRKAGSR